MDTAYRTDDRFYGARVFRGLTVSLVGVALAGAMLAGAGPLRASERTSNGTSDGRGGTPSMVRGAMVRGAMVRAAAGGAQTAAADAAKAADTTHVWTNADLANLPDPSTVRGVAGGAQTAAADAAKAADTTHVWTNADLANLPDPSMVRGAAGGAQTAAADAAKAADTTRVWTNADLAKLPDPGISLIGPEPVTGVEVAPNQEPYDRTKDPYWYADEAARLQAELARRTAALQQYVEAIEDARNRRNTESGIALDQGNAGITLQSGIENLELQVREVQEQLAELADLARRNGIVPGVVWG
jgi:hypothetical protein